MPKGTAGVHKNQPQQLTAKTSEREDDLQVSLTC